MSEHEHEHGHEDAGELDEHGDGYYVHAHITPVATNIKVIAALFALTALTVGAYYVRLGEWNLAVAVLIASVKATLVGTWFMHLKYERAFNTMFFLGALLFMSIFFGYTANDTWHRGAGNGINGTYIDARTGEYANGIAPEYTPAIAALRERGITGEQLSGEFVPLPEGAAHGGHGEAAAAPAAPAGGETGDDGEHTGESEDAAHE